MYEDVGIRKEIAIQKVHRVMNEEVRHGSMSALQAHRNPDRLITNGIAELTPKFLDVFKEIAIKKVHRQHNPVRSKSQRQTLRQTGKYDKEADPTPEFLETFNQIPLGANRQYQLLQLVTQLPEQVQQKVEETNLTSEKAKLLTHKELIGHPDVQDWLVGEIKDKPMHVARAKVKQDTTKMAK